ncbi:MAG: XdhC family protein [Bryobacterales bacterium]|nr:XdhC family protein [Bryobacterales bacterium]
MDVYSEIVRLRREGHRSALATIVASSGSIPGYLGAKLLVREDGSIAGTIGGGCIEAQVITAAREVLETGRARRLTFDLSGPQIEESGLICGGEMEVFLEPVFPQPEAFIFGAGHISRSLSKIASLAGFETVIVDDRESFASRERFPEAARIHTAPYEEIFPKLGINAFSYLLIATRGHKDDLRVLRLAAAGPARYVAMIGSRRKVAEMASLLEKEGLPAAALDRIYAPMGLDIGAVTPEEIAVSVVAEMIAVRRNAASGWRALSMSVSKGGRQSGPPG